MFTLQGRRDGFKLVLPDNFLVDEIKEKYSFILQKNKHFITRPIDFLNETGNYEAIYLTKKINIWKKVVNVVRQI